MSYQPGRMGIAEGMSLVFIMLLPRIFLTAPANDIARTAAANWWVVIVSGLPALLAVIAWSYILQQIPGDLYHISQKLLGRAGAWIITSLCIAFLLLNAALMLRQFAENTLLTALPQTEFSFIVCWYTLVAVLCGVLGLEALARGTYLLMPLSVFSLLVVLISLAPEYDSYNLLPWQGYGLPASLKYGMQKAGSNLGALLLVLVAPSMQTIRTFKWASTLGITGSILVKAFSSLIFTMVFGVAAASEKTLPFFEMARLVYLSRYFQRIESFFIILWVIVGLLGIAISLYMGTYLLTRLLNLPALTPLLPLTAYIIMQLAILPPDIATVIRLDDWMVTKFFTTILFTLTPLLLFMTIVKTKKGGGLSCKLILLTFTLAVCLSVSGCSGARETDEVAYILAVGVDPLPDKQLNITYMIAIPRALSTSESGGTTDKSIAIITLKAPSLAEGRSLLGSTIARAPDLSHIKAWIISQELAQHGLGSLIGPFLRFREFRGSMIMMVVRGSAQDFLQKTKPSIEVLPSRWMEGILLTGTETGYLLPTHVHDFYARLKNNSGAPYTVLADINPLTGKDQPSARADSPERSNEYLPGDLPRTGGNPASVLGTAVFKGDKLAGILTNEETRMVAILLGKFPKGFLTIADPQMPEENIHILLRLGKTPQINARFINSRPVIDISVLLEGEISSIPSNINYEAENSRKILETQVSQIITKQMLAMLTHTQKLETDIVNFGRYFRPMFQSYDEVNSFDWNSLYPEAEIHVQINTKIRRTGLMIKSMPIRGTD